ncbi:MAG: sulfotransferase family protein [Sphingomonadaceae bacterium]
MALSVIGAGFGRTGTLSTRVALELLGFGPCYHMSEVVTQPDRVGQWLEAAAGRPDWDAIFRGYRACVDFPACVYWRELLRQWPDAKVLLNWRDPESWVRSTQETIFSADFVAHIADTPFGAMTRATYGVLFDQKLNDRETLRRVYDAHVAAVQAEVPAARLLVFDVKDGWEPLCRFLGVAVPAVPFPRVNSSEETRAFLEAMMAGRAGPAHPPGVNGS